MSGKSYFYIRFTCNGFTPTLGKEKIMVKYGPDELISSPSCISSVSNPDLAGPFEKISIKGPLPDDVPEAYAYIYFQAGNRTIFSYFYQVSQSEDYDYASAFQLADGTCEYIDDFKYLFEPFSPTLVPGCTTFLKQVLWKKNIINLFSLTPTYESIDGNSFPIYTIDFSDLKLIQEKYLEKSNPTWFIYSYTDPSCSSEPDCTTWTYSPPSYRILNYIHSTLEDVISDSCNLLNMYHYSPWGCAPTYGDFFWIADSPFLDLLASLVGNLNFITSDIYGNSPFFSTVEIHINRLFLHLDLQINYGDQLCELFNFSIPDYFLYSYSMITTPSSYF